MSNIKKYTINMDFVSDAINKILESFYNEEKESFELLRVKLKEDGTETVQHLEDEMNKMLDNLGVQNDVELVWIDEDNTRTCYALCVACVVNGKLYTRNEAIYG